MKYRTLGKNGEQVSILGYGCMRFPKKDGKFDIERTESQVRMAIEGGINYFDTAYVYSQSEEILGHILSKGLRDKVKIATKIPHYMIRSKEGMEKILSTQLQRLRTDHIDYYLLHMITDFKAFEDAKAKGILEFLEEQKKKGVIHNIGFSYHGNTYNFKKIIDAYTWDFCQIQYNYIDETSQAGREGLKHAYEKGIGVVVMEPLRGGKMVELMPDEIQKIWNKSDVKRTYADWAFRWLFDQPEISVVLSGMNEESHFEENIKLANEVQPGTVTAKEHELYHEVKDKYLSLMKVGCTGCGYCMPCPSGVNIPMCFSYYNSYNLFSGKNHTKFQYLGFIGGLSGGTNQLASQCIKCGKCEKVCPQHLPIRQHLAEVEKAMEPFYLKPLLWIVRNTTRLLFGKKKVNA